MTIRPATYSDIEDLMQIFEGARKIMRESGNLTQWDGGYPAEEVVSADIGAGNCYVLDDGHEILGTMALIPGPDPTYAIIQGEWPDDDPYYVIHRIATSSPGRGIARKMLDWAFEYILSEGYNVIRIDTHRDNSIMHHILAKYGFSPCGVIHLADGSPRDAYYMKRPSCEHTDDCM